jgi:hypothetical protein
LQRLEICVYQGYIKGFAKMHHLAQEIKERKTKVEKHEFWYSPKEIKYPNEDNASFYLPNSCTKYNLT